MSPVGHRAVPSRHCDKSRRPVTKTEKYENISETDIHISSTMLHIFIEKYNQL